MLGDLVIINNFFQGIYAQGRRVVRFKSKLVVRCTEFRFMFLIGYIHTFLIVKTSKEPVCPRVELILKIIIILLIIFLGFIKSKPC